MTNLNKQILELIRQSEGHLTAEEVFMLAKDNNINVSLSSTYRILDKFVDEGLIKRIKIENRPDIFDKTICEHQHMVCYKCGKVKDIYIKDLKKYISKKLEDEVASFELSISYLCDDCKKKEKKQ